MVACAIRAYWVSDSYMLGSHSIGVAGLRSAKPSVKTIRSLTGIALIVSEA